MASPSRPPTWKAYGCEPVCLGCGRRVTYDESLHFRGYPKPSGVFGACCAPRVTVTVEARR